MIIKNFEVLNSKKAKNVLRLLKQQWEFKEGLDCGFLQKENDLFLVTTAVDRIELKELNVNSIGMYFGELRHATLRLSIEGSQIIGKRAKKNVIELNDEQLRQWLKGEDIELTTTEINNSSNDCENNSFAIIKHNNDFFGCGRIKDGKLLNFVPKARRVSA